MAAAALKRTVKALHRGDVAAVLQWVQDGGSGANATVNKSGDTLLMLAARHSQPAVLAALLECMLRECAIMSLSVSVQVSAGCCQVQSRFWQGLLRFLSPCHLGVKVNKRVLPYTEGLPHLLPCSPRVALQSAGSAHHTQCTDPGARRLCRCLKTTPPFPFHPFTSSTTSILSTPSTSPPSPPLLLYPLCLLFPSFCAAADKNCHGERALTFLTAASSTHLRDRTAGRWIVLVSD